MERIPSGTAYNEARSWITLALLGLLYILSFIDRTILALLMQPLKTDMGLGDVQLGLLFGSVFALFYAVASLPIARLADRYSRKRLIATGVVFWSLCTIASAFAQSFTQLALLRFGLAIGEAALTPAAYSMITDMFGKRQRMSAATIFSACGMTGSATAYLIGGALIHWIEHTTKGGFLNLSMWRVVFVLVGIPGILVALALTLIAREPSRRHIAVDWPSFADVLAHIWSRGWLYIGLFGGAGLGQVSVNAIVAWGPTFLQKRYGMSIPESGADFGLAQAFAAVGGAVAIATAMRWLIARDRFTIAAFFPVVASVTGALIILIAPLLGGAAAFLVAYALGGFLLIGMSNAILIVLQQIAPPTMRATLTATTLICVSSIGLGIGPPLAAFVAKLAVGAVTPLIWGIVAVALTSLAGTMSLLWLAARPLARALSDAAVDR